MKSSFIPRRDPKTGHFVSTLERKPSLLISNFTSKKHLIALGFVLILGLTLVPSCYFYSQYKKARRQLQNPDFILAEEKKRLIAQLGKLIVLPEGEEPTIATVSDQEKLKNQPFFSKAKNGDKVLVYSQAKKAILYDPLANKIIDVVALNLTLPNTPTPALTKLVLYNGTKVIGLTKTAEALIREKLSNFQVVDRNNAKLNNYEKSLVINLTNINSALIEDLAKTLNAQVGSLPQGEVKPENADVLVILGQPRPSAPSPTVNPL